MGNKRKKNHPEPIRVEKIYIEWFNILFDRAITSSSEIPNHVMECMLLYDHLDLSKIPITVYRQKGMSAQQISIALDLTFSEVRTVLSSCGYMK